MKIPSLVLIASIALSASACALDELELGAASQEGKMLNGKMLNGKMLNGTSLQVTAAYPEPGVYEGVALGGTVLGDSPVDAVSLHATELSGKHEGRWIRGRELEGAVIAGLDDGRQPVQLHIDAISRDASGLWLYSVVAETRAGKAWLCGTDSSGNPIAAIPVAGVWDHHQGSPGDGGKIPGSSKYGISFGCRGTGAIAKCVDLGYWPWLSGDHDLAHQSCVRMVRADYCGDGRSWTKDGTLIDIEDELPHQHFSEYDPSDKQEAWMFEATWSPDGATCIERFRYHDLNPVVGTSIYDEVKLGTCPNLPLPVDDYDARKFLNAYQQGGRAGRQLCKWEQPECDPKVQACAGDQGVDYYGFTTVNAKGPGTW